MIGRVFAEMWQGLRRNSSMVISVVLVTFVSLTFVGAGILMQQQISSMKSFWYDRAQVSVDLCSSVSSAPNCAGGQASESQREAVEAALQGAVLTPYISEYEFEDQDQAYANFQQQFAGDPIVSFVEPEYLSESFLITLTDPDQADIIIQQLEGYDGVEAVTDQRQYLESIFELLNVASLSAIGVAVVMLVAAALLIATTIRLSAISRRREIGIMRLVGASNRYIQAPFILEGIVAALIGAVLASGATLAIAHFFVQGYLGRQLPFVSLIGVPEALLAIPVLLVVSVLLAWVSARIAINKYLKV